MTDSTNQSFCHFCQRKLSSGEDRYRCFQKEKAVECCPSCFNEARAFPRHQLGEPAGKQQPYKPEKEF